MARLIQPYPATPPLKFWPLCNDLPQWIESEPISQRR